MDASLGEELHSETPTGLVRFMVLNVFQFYIVANFMMILFGVILFMTATEPV